MKTKLFKITEARVSTKPAALTAASSVENLKMIEVKKYQQKNRGKGVNQACCFDCCKQGGKPERGKKSWKLCIQSTILKRGHNRIFPVQN